MSTTADSGYDIIGDIHGCAEALAQLLQTMGYKQRNGVFSHDSRQVIFVGDIVDRGPHIREALDIVYSMVEFGSAQMVMGNHEYNLYCYATKSPHSVEGEYLREHTPHSDRLVAETYEQFKHHSAELDDYIDWFSRLPLFLDLQDLRVVHACWDDHYIQRYREMHQTHLMSPDIILNSVNPTSETGLIVDRLIRGICLDLPDHYEIRSRDGHIRRLFRTKFWAEKPKTYADVVFQPDPLPSDLVHRELNEDELSQLTCYSTVAKPIFFGHYWLQGRPQPIRHNMACLDYSAVKYGRLVAYRFDGEQQLDPDKYVWVYIDPEEYQWVSSHG